MNQLGRITALFNDLKANLGLSQTKLKVKAKTRTSKVSKKSKAKSRTVKTKRTSKRKSVRKRK